jgi:hypothetical protein
VRSGSAIHPVSAFVDAAAHYGQEACPITKRLQRDAGLLQTIVAWVRKSSAEQSTPSFNSSAWSPQRDSLVHALNRRRGAGGFAWRHRVSLRSHGSCVGVLKNPPFERPNSGTLYLSWIAGDNGV